jgi:hypothetical protein
VTLVIAIGSTNALLCGDLLMPTAERLEQQLNRWTEAGILDSESATRIREFESAHESGGMRWPVVLAIAFGAIMVAAGVLLFVAAHWDELSPTERFLLVVTMVAGFHVGGGLTMPRLRPLGLALHGIGTVALGGGIFLAGQIFNLQEHWPGGILLWAIGAVLSWLVLRDWLQAALSALLLPAWIASEWSVRAQRYSCGAGYCWNSSRFWRLPISAPDMVTRNRISGERWFGWVGLPFYLFVSSSPRENINISGIDHCHSFLFFARCGLRDGVPPPSARGGLAARQRSTLESGVWCLGLRRFAS